MASAVPLCELWPKLALPPVSEANSPTLISSWAKAVMTVLRAKSEPRKVDRFIMDAVLARFRAREEAEVGSNFDRPGRDASRNVRHPETASFAAKKNAPVVS